MVWDAYKQVRKNGGSAGVDGISLNEFSQDLAGNLYRIWNRLASGSYFPPPVMEVSIPKQSGGQRKLGIPTVADRVAQMVIKNYIEPKIEPYFDLDSYGYRLGRNAHQALEQARNRNRKFAWAIDMDIKGFFDNIDHDLLMKALKKHVQEKWALMYIERWLKASLETSTGIQKREDGTPQGGVISPILANLYLHYAFDRWIRINYPEVEFERYADDIVVHCSSKEDAEKVLEAVRNRMQQCNLELHPVKTKIVYCKDYRRKEFYDNVSYSFLGYTFQPRATKSYNGGTFIGFDLAISKDALKTISETVRKMKLQRRSSATIEDIAEMLNPKIRGWIYYYGKFRRQKLYKFLYRINVRLLKWVKVRYKRFNGSTKKAEKWLSKVYKTRPELFLHWQYVKPYCFD